MPPELWKIVPLGEYAKVIMGQSPESDYYTDDPQEMPFLQGNRTFGLKYPTFDTYTSKVTKVAPKNSVLISVRAPVGDVNVAPTELCLGRGVASLESEDPDNEFLYYLMKNQSAQLNQNENGSTFGSINRSDLQRLPVLLPDYDTRRKIGHILATIDTKINRNQLINDNLMRTCREYYHKVVVSSSSTIMLSDLAEVCYGKDHKHLKDGSYPVYGSGGIMRYCEKPLYQGKESVLIPRKGSLNNVLFVSKPFWSVDTMFYTKMRKSFAGKYLYFWLTEQNLADMNSGSAVPSMTTDILNDIEIMYPGDEVLVTFDKCLQPLFDLFESNNQQIIHLTRIRDYLLPKLMSGEIDVSTLDLPTKYSFSAASSHHE